jgi:hypothetical protein
MHSGFGCDPLSLRLRVRMVRDFSPKEIAMGFNSLHPCRERQATSAWMNRSDDLFVLTLLWDGPVTRHLSKTRM